MPPQRCERLVGVAQGDQKPSAWGPDHTRTSRIRAPGSASWVVERSIQRGASISQATPSQQSANGPLTEEPIHAGESDEPGESTRAVDKGQLAGLVGVATEYLEKKLSASSRPDEPDLFIPSPEDITDAQHAAALGEQIAHVLSRPDLIRQRAQHAAAICGAAATVLGAFAALSGLERGTESLIALGVAFNGLAFSMGVYVHAITCSYTDKLRSDRVTSETPRKISDELVEQFRAEADFLRGGVGQGRRVTWAAIALTLAALALLVSRSV